MRSAVVDLGVQPIRNYVKTPRGQSFSTQTPSGAGAGSYQSTLGPDGGGAYRALPTASGQLRMNHRSSGERTETYPGQQITIQGWFYSSRELAGFTFETQYFTPANVSLVWAKSATFTVKVGWNFLRQVVTTPAGAGFYGQSQVLGPGGTTVGTRVEAGDEFRWTQVVMTQGDYNGPYVDGNASGWRWTGQAEHTESVGYPLPRYVSPDPTGMSGWIGATGYKAITTADPGAVPGSPYPSFIRIGQFDTRLNNAAQWAPSNYGRQSWAFEGWAAAPTDQTSNLTINLRYGSVYTNAAPAGGFSSAIAGINTLQPDSYRTWKPFKLVVTYDLPNTITVPNITPNIGQGAVAVGATNTWQLAGLNWRRAVQGETSIVA